MRPRLILLCSLFLPAAICSSQPEELTRPLALFFETKFEQALPLFEKLTSENPKNAEALTWLAETYRRLGRKDDAIAAVRRALGLQPCSSFAHLVLAQASYPDHDTIIVYVAKAIECDSTDPNAWLMLWGEAIRDGNPGLRNKCLRKLVETGFFTNAALAYGRAELRTLPPNAVLITNGDMDTYPAQAVQVSESFRSDVAVIERGDFAINWGCRFIRDHQHVSLPISDSELDLTADSADANGFIITKADQVFRGMLNRKLNGTFDRPIALAPTVEESFYAAVKDHFRYHGMFWLWQRESSDGTPDTASVRRSIAGIDPDEFAGPWASTKDRSPIRRFYSNGIARVLSHMALRYSSQMVRAHRDDEAKRVLDWLERFEEHTEQGQVSTDEIHQLRSMLR